MGEDARQPGLEEQRHPQQKRDGMDVVAIGGEAVGSQRPDNQQAEQRGGDKSRIDPQNAFFQVVPGGAAALPALRYQIPADDKEAHHGDGAEREKAPGDREQRLMNVVAVDDGKTVRKDHQASKEEAQEIEVI